MGRPVYYAQNAPAWGKMPYTIDGDVLTETIGKSGCGPTCMAMILATWVNPEINPIKTCKLAILWKDRTADDGTEWEFFKHMGTKYNLPFKQTSSTKEAIEALKDGALVVCSMGPGYFTKHGHFILAYKYENGNIYVNDPASTERTHASTELFQKECKQYFIFTKPVTKKATLPPKKTPPKPEMTVEEAIDILVKKGYMKSGGYWDLNAREGHYVRFDFAVLLMKNLSGLSLLKKLTVGYEGLIKILVDKDIINSPDYWLTNKGKDLSGANAGLLIINAAKKLLK